MPRDTCFLFVVSIGSFLLEYTYTRNRSDLKNTVNSKIVRFVDAPPDVSDI